MDLLKQNDWLTLWCLGFTQAKKLSQTEKAPCDSDPGTDDESMGESSAKKCKRTPREEREAQVNNFRSELSKRHGSKCSPL